MSEPAQTAPAASKFVDLLPRVASAAALVAAALLTLIAGGDLFALFWLAAAFAIFWEWQTLIAAERRSLRVAAGLVGLLGAAACLRLGVPVWSAVTVGLLAVVAAILAGSGRRLWAAGGALYAGVLLLSVILLRQSPDLGTLAIAWLFAIVWGSDIFAYFGGRLIGGPKLWPRVSAGKTWSGTITGLVCGAALGLAVARMGAGVALAPAALLGLFLAALSQIGDLFESAVKRRFGVKDSSRLIPGHGGVMDRLDGFIFACGFAALFGVLRDHASAAAGLFLW